MYRSVIDGGLSMLTRLLLPGSRVGEPKSMLNGLIVVILMDLQRSTEAGTSLLVRLPSYPPANNMNASRSKFRTICLLHCPDGASDPVL